MADNQGNPLASTGFDAAALMQALAKRTDVALAIGIIGIITVLIVPMPAWLLDVGLAISITFAVLILMTALFIEKPLDFSSFPTILLIATMLRLSLNLASTRLILSDGHTGTQSAGEVIAAFGTFLMGENTVIGIIVFAILVIVNFIVITKGSGRIAEVSARFSLDAMPGKQMAIDADLSAGLINDTQAKARRKQLEDETNFFGSMDGAAKFVRGDAIAGLLITFINVIGGIIIGIVQQDMPFAEAGRVYTFLTIGDGLVTQIPALLVSVAAGILVTKSGVEGSADKALVAQLGNSPSALYLVSGAMTIMAFLPGIPTIIFLAMAGMAGGAAFFSQSTKTQAAATQQQTETKQLQAQQQKAAAEEPIAKVLHLDQIRLELGYGLLPMIQGEEGMALPDQIKSLRRQIAAEFGYVVPSIRIQDNLQLGVNDYIIRIKEIDVGRGTIKPNGNLVMNPTGGAIELNGEMTTEPTFGLPAMWVQSHLREQAHQRGYTVVEPATVLITHLTEVIKDNMPDLLSYAETQKLLDQLDKEYEKLIADVIPDHITVSGLQRVLQSLLRERVTIRDLPTILEGVVEAASISRNITMITEHVRMKLRRCITEANLNEEGVLTMLTLSPEWERIFADALVGQGDDKQLALAPSKLHDFIQKSRDAFERQATLGHTPVLLTSGAIRPYVRSIIERFRPITVVMSQNEVHPKAKIKTLGAI